MALKVNNNERNNGIKRKRNNKVIRMKAAKRKRNVAKMKASAAKMK
jgi:hypothetical protein